MFSFIKEMTPEEKRERDRVNYLYEFYGIPVDEWDDKRKRGKKEEVSQQERDYSVAVYLINFNKEIPKDLHERLLFYKKSKDSK